MGKDWIAAFATMMVAKDVGGEVACHIYQVIREREVGLVSAGKPIDPAFSGNRKPPA